MSAARTTHLDSPLLTNGQSRLLTAPRSCLGADGICHPPAPDMLASRPSLSLGLRCCHGAPRAVSPWGVVARCPADSEHGEVGQRARRCMA